MKPVRNSGRTVVSTMGLVCALLGVVSVAADEVITNPVSPVVSYQYLEDFASGALTNGGVMSPVVSYQYLEDFTSGALTNGGVMSPVVSYQYLEWPGNDVLGAATSLPVSYFWQFGPGGYVVVYGRVRNGSGAAIANATISAAVKLIPAAQTASDANGNYTLPALGSGAYILEVEAPGYAGATRVVILGGSASMQNFQLAAVLSPPSVVETDRQPAPAFIPPSVDNLGSTLKIFDGTSVVNITANNAPSRSLPTIVLTHGWVNEDPNQAIMSTPFDGWPLGMANQLQMAGLTPSTANILVWDWRYASMSSGFPPSPIVYLRIPTQGVELGTELQKQLGTGYSAPLHFMGHSLGTLVNASALNYLHGDRTGTSKQPVAPTAWKHSTIHVTLFDNAELEGLFGGTPNPLGSLGDLVESTMKNWQDPMPVYADWADNYISQLGTPHDRAVNIYLQKGNLDHSYAWAWYTNSVANPTRSVLGFHRSDEYRRLSGLAGTSFSAFVADFPVGSTSYAQTPLAPDELALSATMYGFGKAPFLGITALHEAQVEIQKIQKRDQVVAAIEDRAQAYWQWTVNGFNNAVDSAEQSVLDVWKTSTVGLTLTTGRTKPNPQIQAHTIATLTTTSSDSQSTNGPMAWVSVVIPTNAIALAFDFSIAGDPSNDVLVCGIDTNSLFLLEAKNIPDSYVSTSRLLDISAWAGTTNELFFGLMGGTSTNASLLIDNIRFYSLQSTNSDVVDSVGDGIPDAWRAQYFTEADPTGTTTNNLSCAACDADGTGQNNLFKYLAGLDPTNNASVFRITSVAPQGNDIQITWQAGGGRTNVVEFSPDLSGAYSNVSPNIVLPGGGDITTNYLDAGGATNSPTRFYRIRLVQ